MRLLGTLLFVLFPSKVCVGEEADEVLQLVLKKIDQKEECSMKLSIPETEESYDFGTCMLRFLESNFADDKENGMRLEFEQ
jgi:hypothetical protein